ncbi:MAG: plasmid pRiA4b ORF-3 family protein [Deltaproteobacteria bacterium]|jgi:hypothetical protein|nr:plasmid pRiA4b ORF-3 family protein [Deltaproteobacteria bacterium]
MASGRKPAASAAKGEKAAKAAAGEKGGRAARAAPFYSFRIELKYVRPKIWRYFFVPSNISLFTFNKVIQAVMGWEGFHLHSFTIFGEEMRSWSKEIDNGGYIANDMQMYGNLRGIKLDRLGLSKGDWFSYLYDMGDSWTHLIKVLDTDYTPKTPGARYCCFGGARASPPEDCGGVMGYEDALEILSDPDSDEDEREELSMTFGDSFDPEEFDIVAINERLGRLAK